MIFNVIIKYLFPETEDYPITRTLVAADRDDAEKFLKDQGLDYIEICDQLEIVNQK